MSANLRQCLVCFVFVFVCEFDRLLGFSTPMRGRNLDLAGSQ